MKGDNMSQFDFLQKHCPDFYLLCTEVEKKTKTRPVTAAIEMRKCLESFLSKIIKRYMKVRE